MGQILNVAGERSRASEVALQSGVASERPGLYARELTQWPTAQQANHGIDFMAADSDRQSDKVCESGQ
ncbi:MAG: hypothetical protein SV201_07000 [Pseudomonadota bacterium]|nr:hypothetical protein [Pseudomonadota bacterium]